MSAATARTGIMREVLVTNRETTVAAARIPCAIMERWTSPPASSKVTDILVGEQLRHEISADGETCRLRFDSVEVFIDFNVWQDDGVVITVHSVVQDIDPESPGAAQALNLLNDLNRSYFFVKFVFRDGLLIARRDLLGDTLSPAELVSALYEVAGASNRLRGELVGLAR